MARGTISPYDTLSVPPGRWNQPGRLVSLAAMPTKLPMRKGVGIGHLGFGSRFVVFEGLMLAHFLFNVRINLFSIFGGGVGWAGLTQIRNFAFAWAVLHFVERRKRICEEKEGQPAHTWSQGVSRFGLEKLLGLLGLPERWTAIAVEPAIAFLCGAVMRRLGLGPLGILLMISAACFAVSQIQVAENEKQDIRDRNDQALENQRAADLMKGRSGEPPREEAGAGLSTGLGGLNFKPQAGAENSAMGGEA